MGYVGNQTTTAYTSMTKQDITGDGTSNYTLSHAVANANEIEVYINNVRQEPTTAYSASGTALTMTGTVASSDNFYVVFQGKAVGTVTPPDGSVSTAKIADSAVSTAKLADNSVTSAKITGVSFGKVLQVIAGYATSETSNNSVTYVATPLSATITPSSTSSKILIQTSGGFLYVPANGTGRMTIYKDSTNLNTLAGTPSDSFVRATGYAGQNVSVPVNMQVLDSPNTTSAITYKVYMRSSNTGYMLQFGNHGIDNSQMILMEIGG